MRHVFSWYGLFFLCAALFLTSCSSQPYVRHLASDVSLIVPQETTKKQILSFMGQPDQKRDLSESSEEWTYFQTNKSALRKTPYVGHRIGSENYDVVMVVFNGDIVQTSTYRLLNENEFAESGIKSDVQKIDAE